MCIKLLLSTTRKYLVLEFKLNNTAQIGPQSHKSFILNPNQKHCTSKPKRRIKCLRGKCCSLTPR